MGDVEPVLHLSDVVVINQVLRTIQDLDRELERDGQAYISGPIEVWSRDEYRLGVVENVTGVWQFRFDYKDA